MDIRVRVHGVDSLMRDLARTNIQEEAALRRGINEAAKFLMTKIREKMGIYQPTGGTGGGPWSKLTFETNKRKLRKFGFSNKPLIATGKMKDSFYVHDTTSKGHYMSSVGNSDPIMEYHVYGTSRVPPRDPMLVTAEEQKDECRKIIIDSIYKAYE